MAHILHIIDMKIAIPQWKNRVSPVFDVAGTFILIEIEEGHEQRREKNSFQPGEAFNRVGMLRQLGVEVLICGAVSRPLEGDLVSAGNKSISIHMRRCG